MEIIGEKELMKARVLNNEDLENKNVDLGINDKTFSELLAEMENPVNAQKEIAVKIKRFLDVQMDKEMDERGYLSDNTRKWVDSFNSILEKIQKAIHGDKSVNLHLHKVSHGDIAAKIRSSENAVDNS